MFVKWIKEIGLSDRKGTDKEFLESLTKNFGLCPFRWLN